MKPKDLPDPFIEDPALRLMIEVTDEGHWLWQGELDHQGYGTVWREGYNWRAHRWVWFLAHGFTELPIDHFCRVRMCVNAVTGYIPGTLFSDRHLEAVTTAENNRRIPRPENCPRCGHPYDGRRSDGSRRCLNCHRIRERERRARARST